MKTITPELLDELIDFAPTESAKRSGFAAQQREGTVGLFNMLARNRCAYLADEVGMGKTYVALAIMSLLRYFDPHARVIVIAPRENIQLKWVKELRNFVRVNWKIVGNRVKALQGGPVWEPVVCHNLLELAHEALVNQDRDFFLRMTSFSLALKDPDRQKNYQRRLKALVPWLKRRHFQIGEANRFRDDFGRALNAAMPDADLLIVDEAHNLKHGFGPRVSNRNRILGFALGHPDGENPELTWYRPRAKRVLLLSATPFEEEYGAIQRQLAVLGFGDAGLLNEKGEDLVSVRALIDQDVPEARKREVVDRLLIRRASGLRINGELHTKNMYRREWRRGGFQRHDEPMVIENVEQKLIVALMQKKVAEILQSERFNNSFQIGMLSSFESFLESVGRMRPSGGSANGEGEEQQKFDGEDQNRRATRAEREGIDTEAIRALVRSYRERFGHTLPHPKLDTTAKAHEDVFDTGEKALIFVRRVATVAELAAKLEEAFDRWVRKRMEAALPALHAEIATLFARYERERVRRPEELVRHDLSTAPVVGGEPDQDLDEEGFTDESDEGGAETFFAWFFRGTGPERYLSGAAFQRYRLASTSSTLATLFEDDYVAALIEAAGDDVLPALAQRLGADLPELTRSLRGHAYAHFVDRSRRREGYPRRYVFEAYQVAALRALAQQGDPASERAKIILAERFSGSDVTPVTAPAGFPSPKDHLGVTTIFTELRRRPALRAQIWPVETDADFRNEFRRTEQRRELLSAVARLGAAYVDLYLLAIGKIGGFSLRTRAEDPELAAELSREFLDLLETQSRESGFNAYQELSQTSAAFDHLVAVNFPDLPNLPLTENSRLFGATLQRQVPVGRMSGGVNSRLVRQFRMPGFPLVLVSTDVLQEGEDLHTFCRRVVHYGISWTSSATEQRTGRVDRIGGLVQRELDGAGFTPEAEKLIQVHFPHLRDTVEVIQVRRVLKRLNRFLELMHDRSQIEDRDSRIDASRAILEEVGDIPQLTTRLEPAFPVRPDWLAGAQGPDCVVQPDWKRQFNHLDEFWRKLLAKVDLVESPQNERRSRAGEVLLVDRRLATASDVGSLRERQEFTLELRSQTAGDATLLRCRCDVGGRDLRSDEEVDELLTLQHARGLGKLCYIPRTHADLDRIHVENDILFDPETTELPELTSLIERTATLALAIRNGPPQHRRKQDGKASLDALLERADVVTETMDVRWTRKGSRVTVELVRHGRRQAVSLATNGPLYRFTSLVAGPDHVAKRATTRREIARRAWRRNARTDVIAFAVDRHDRLVGFIDEPASAMHPSELAFYINILAMECDRFEYILTGEDSR